ncbi:MAG: hypothetical protein HND52_15235 [Ignavibacteriae bacterium]|nr:hypothetical protein [Ignavibacteriota bacterium]NOG99308.1 hypothetical protein [Ignavibacteriota bacterium]
MNLKSKLLFSLIIILIFSSCTEDKNTYIPPKTSVVDQQFNFHIAAPGVWRSSQPNQTSLEKMKMHGLKTIINLRGDEETNNWESEFSDSLGLQYFNEPLDARDEFNTEQVQRILDIVADTANQPVLIHCLGGKDRTGLITGIYNTHYLGKDFDEVKKETIMFGHDAENYPEVLNTIFNWKK